jgi:DNA replication protein DnaC
MNNTQEKPFTQIGEVEGEEINLFRAKANEMRKANGKEPRRIRLKDRLMTKDEHGRVFCDLSVLHKIQEKDASAAAFEIHKNNPDKRQDLCGFPKLRREFMMTYPYKEMVKGFNFESWDWQFLHGSNGTGKTTLACRQGWEWMKPVPARYVTFLSICEWIRSLQLSFSESDTEYVELPDLKNFVILDDFDKFQYTKEWQILQIFRLVDHLYRSDKKVIITANKSFDEIVEKTLFDGIMETAIDRIKERVRGSVINLTGKSYR